MVSVRPTGAAKPSPVQLRVQGRLRALNMIAKSRVLGAIFGIFSGPEVQKLRSGSYCSYLFRVIWTSLMAATAAIIISNSIIFYYNIPILLHCTHVVYCMTLPYMISSCLLYYITYCITCTIGVGTRLAQLRQDYTVNRDSRNCEHVCVTYYAQTPVHERLCIIM